MYFQEPGGRCVGAADRLRPPDNAHSRAECARAGRLQRAGGHTGGWQSLRQVEPRALVKCLHLCLHSVDAAGEPDIPKLCRGCCCAGCGNFCRSCLGGVAALARETTMPAPPSMISLISNGILSAGGWARPSWCVRRRGSTGGSVVAAARRAQRMCGAISATSCFRGACRTMCARWPLSPPIRACMGRPFGTCCSMDLQVSTMTFGS